MSVRESFLNPLLNTFSGIVPIRVYSLITGQKVILPTYHVVADGEVPHISNLYNVRNERLFRKDLEFFLKNFTPISLEELIKWKKGELNLSRPSFFLSFDDGFREVKEVIAPILKSKGIPAAFFINPAFVDNKELMFRNKASLLLDLFRNRRINISETYKETGISEEDFINEVKSLKYNEKDLLDKLAEISGYSFSSFLKEKRPYLETAEIHQLRREGFHIGAHSVDHPQYSQISLNQQYEQTMQSVDFVLNNQFSEIKSFAFPFTDFGVTSDFFNQMYGSGKLECSFGVAGIKHENIRFHFQRIPMEKSLEPARKIISAEYLYYIMKSPFGKNFIKR